VGCLAVVASFRYSGSFLSSARAPAVGHFKKGGFVVSEEGKFKITDDGVLLSSEAVEEFVADDLSYANQEY
jgi:hypothetical protein